MDPHILILAVGFSLFTSTGHMDLRAASVLGSELSPGGPPAMRIAGKSGGDITATHWEPLTQVEIVGCVPGARITALNVCIKDCQGKDAGYNGKSGSLTDAMKTMVKNLPPGTPFIITVKVVDKGGKALEVPPARFVWKG